MADQQEMHAIERKKKERKDKLKKGFSTFVLLALALMMIVSLSPGMMDGRRTVSGETTVATMKGARFDYGPGTPFNYLISAVQNSIRSQYGDSFKGDQLHQISLMQSANYLRSMALAHAEARRIGLEPSKDWMRYSLRRLNPNISLNNVTPGMRQYIEMEYAASTLSPQGGDMVSVVAPVTIAELYSYFDLVNYAVQAEVIYLEITNYILSSIQDSELEAWYSLNPRLYSDAARVETLNIQSKEGSEEIQTYILKNGWDAGIQKYVQGNDQRITYTPERVINDKTSPRLYEAVINNSSNDLVLSPVLEEKSYHIIHIRGYNDFRQLNDWTKQNIRNDYAQANFSKLRSAQDNTIQDLVSRVENRVRNGQSLSQGSAGTPFKYFKSFSISPVNQILRDDKSQTVDLPLMGNRKWMDFLFTAEPGSLSKTYYSDGYVVIFKLLKRGINEAIDYDKIDQEIYQRYMYFKNNAVSQDWSQHLDKKYQFKLNQENIRKLY